MAGVKWYAEGVFHRETVLGKEMSAKFVTPLVAGALIYNRLFAWKESFAVVGLEHAGLCVSSEFPQFLPDTARVIPEFLYLFCTRPKIIEMVNAASVGSAAVSRNRFKEEELLKLEMPLPPLAEQRAIVERWRSAQAQIAAASVRVEKQDAICSEEFLSSLGITPPPATDRPKCFALHWTGLNRWSVASATDSILGLDKLAESKFEYARLGELATVSYGIQKCPANRPGQHPHPYLRVANVRKGYLDLTEVKQIDVPDNELESYRLQPGDILFVEGNGSRAELGRVAKWTGEIGDCVHQNHLIKVRVDALRLSPDFAMIWFNTEIGRSHFFRSAKTSSGLGTINSNEVRSAPIPLPPLEVQRKLVERVTAARAEIARERAAAAKLRQTIAAEVESLILGTKPLARG
jgi:type I restriction enzyme S subunit